QMTVCSTCDTARSLLGLPLFSLSSAVARRHLPSFPTRRSSDLPALRRRRQWRPRQLHRTLDSRRNHAARLARSILHDQLRQRVQDRKSTRLNSSHRTISYAVFCLKKKKKSHICQLTLPPSLHAA